MKALVLHELKAALQLEDRPDPTPGVDEVIVELKAAALNRRDFWITQGLYPGIQLPTILGSDGAGIVTTLGEGVADSWHDASVIINPGWHWGEHPEAQGADFRILGMPNDGTFATHVRVPVKYLHRKPDHLDWSEAAALPLAGLTAYRAVFTQGQVQPGEDVLVTGIGGGVATFALQFASAVGANVFVTSSSADKLARSGLLGAVAGYDYTAGDWTAWLLREHGHPHLIIDGAGGEGFARLIDLVAPGGRIVCYGATAGPPKKLDLFKVFWKQLHIIGSTMGSPDDFVAMLELVAREAIRPVIDEVIPLEAGPEAVARMAESRQFGKVVLEIA